MLPINSEYYGDESRWFIGTVIDNTPPYGMEGKVKIHIDGIHSTDTNDIKHMDLPWAQVAMPANTGGASGHGAIPQLLPQSRVFGFFLDGKQSQLPLVLGHMHTTEMPNTTQQRNILIPEEPPAGGNRKFASEFFLNIGYRPHIAATIVGAAETLSGLDPAATSGERFGLMHWDKGSDRYTSLVKYGESLGKTYGPDNIVTQLGFIAFELRTSRSEIVGNMNRTSEIDDKPVKTKSANDKSKYIAGLGSASMLVPYFDKSYQKEIISDKLSSFRTKGKDVFKEFYV